MTEPTISSAKIANAFSLSVKPNEDIEHICTLFELRVQFVC